MRLGVYSRPGAYLLLRISKVRWTSGILSYRRPPPTAAMAFICNPKKLPAKRQGCFSPSDALKGNYSMNINENSLDKLIAWRMTDRSTQSLQLNSTGVQCVRHAHLGPWCLFETRHLFFLEQGNPRRLNGAWRLFRSGTYLRKYGNRMSILSLGLVILCFLTHNSNYCT